MKNKLSKEKLIALKITLIYWVLGCLWIMFSDSALHFFFHDTTVRTKLSIFKGCLYVFFSGILLCWLIYHYVRAYFESRKASEEADKKYRALVDNANESILVVQEGMIKFANLTAMKVGGYSEDELITKPLLEFVHPDDRELVTENYKKRMNREPAPTRYTFRVLTKKGDVVWMETGATGIEWEGKPAALNFLTDITERKQAEEKIVESELKLRTLFEGVNYSISIFNDGILISANPAFMKLFGYHDSSEFIGKPGIELIAPEERKRVNEYLTNRMKGLEAPTHYETKGLRKDGSIFDMDMQVSTYVLNNVTYMVGFQSDITESKRALEELRENEAKFRAAFMTSNDIYMISRCDDGRILEVNDRVLELYGYTREEIIGKTSVELGMWVYPEARQEMLDQLKKYGRVVNFEVLTRCKGGDTLWILATLNELKTKGPPIMLSISRDITAFKMAEQEKELQLQRITALHKIDMAIASSLDLNVTLNIVLDQVIQQLQVDAADILRLNPNAQTLEYAASHGFSTKSMQKTQLRLGEGYAGKSALERKLIFLPDINKEQDSSIRDSLLKDERFVSYYCVPLIAKGNVKGVLEVFHRKSLNSNAEWVNFLNILAGQTAIAIDNAELFTDLQYSNTNLLLSYDTTIEGWSKALDLRDKETEGHTQRVTELTMRLAKEMGIDEKEMVHIRRGALLHDIGKMGIPDNILLKPGKLTDEEWVIMKKHPVYAYDLLYPITYLRPALDIPYYHHEKWDGTGYPQGLKGEQIPLSARIFAIIDVWDALRSDRPYRKAWEKEKTLEHIKIGIGTHFDPKVVEIFLKMQG